MLFRHHFPCPVPSKQDQQEQQRKDDGEAEHHGPSRACYGWWGQAWDLRRTRAPENLGTTLYYIWQKLDRKFAINTGKTKKGQLPATG